MVQVIVVLLVVLVVPVDQATPDQMVNQVTRVHQATQVVSDSMVFLAVQAFQVLRDCR